MRWLSWKNYLSYGWTLRTKFLECFPGTSVCGPYFWAPLPCWALATQSDIMHIMTNDIIINAKINAPELIFIHFYTFLRILYAFQHFNKHLHMSVRVYTWMYIIAHVSTIFTFQRWFYPITLLVYPSCLFQSAVWIQLELYS